MRTLPENVGEAALLSAVAKGDLAFISCCCCLQNYVYRTESGAIKVAVDNSLLGLPCPGPGDVPQKT